MWVIANFVDENNVEVVPSCWIDGEECYWPTLPRDKLKKHIEKQIVPDGSSIWELYKARIIGKPYDDLQKARQKSNMALTRSDIETDQENKKRKVIRTKRYNIFDSSSSEGGDLLSSPDKEAVCKKAKKSLWPQAQKKEMPKTVDSPLKIPGDLPQPRRSPRKLIQAKTTPIRCQSSSAWHGQSELQEMPSISSKHQIGSSTKKESFEQACIHNQNTIKNYLRSMFGEIASLRDKVDWLIAEKDGAIQADKGMEQSHFINDLPAKTLDDLLALEDVLKEKEKETELVNFLARLGGTNVGDACRRCLRASLTDEVACTYSWAGQKGKKIFSTLKLRTVIFKAVLKQFKDAKEKELEGMVKDWLRPSRNRLLSKEKNLRKQGLVEIEADAGEKEVITESEE